MCEISMKDFKKGDKKVLNAWAFYDWANSVYALVISSSIFPLYYGALFRERGLDSFVLLGMDIRSESIISYVTSIGFFVIVLISPVLSGIADYLGIKKFFLKLFCGIGAASCILLYFFSLDHIGLSLFVYMMALIGFWGSLVFYNSYLPDIAFPEQQDKISAKGYGLGYLGSVLLLIVNLIMLIKHRELGFATEMEAMRVAFVLVGVWWLGFSFYTYKHLPDFKNEKKISKEVLGLGMKELRKVWDQLGELKTLKTYLIAFFLYSMAVQTVMIIAAYFGEKEVQWSNDSERTTGLIVSILLIQLIAILGAYLTSLLSSKIGNINALIVMNVLWVFICMYAYTIATPNQFYIAAACVGLVMGGIQSLSRSTYSKLLPDTKDTTSFFSFYDVTEKLGIVIGMFLYGYIADITGKMQNAVLFLILFFVGGIVVLSKLSKESRKMGIR